VLVTPVRDQAGLLDDLVATIRAQERRPERWVIVDDGSTDDSPRRLQKISAREPWVHVVLLPQVASGKARTYAERLVQSFRSAAELAEAEAIDHGWVINLDPDLRCSPQLLAELIERSHRDRSVGMCSCTIAEVGDDGGLRRERDIVDGIPRADLRVWRRECLEEVGMRAAPRWAETTGLWARNRGWQTPVFEDLVVEAARPGVLRDGLHGFVRHGAEGWHVGLHPLVLAEQALAASVHDRDLRGVAMVAGYVEAAFSGRKRSRDPELRQYFGDELLKERARELLSRVPMVGRRFRRRG